MSEECFTCFTTRFLRISTQKGGILLEQIVQLSATVMHFMSVLSGKLYLSVYPHCVITSSIN